MQMWEKFRIGKFILSQPGARRIGACRALHMLHGCFVRVCVCNNNMAWNFCVSCQTIRRGNEAAWAAWPFQGTPGTIGLEVVAGSRDVQTSLRNLERVSTSVYTL